MFAFAHFATNKAQYKYDVANDGKEDQAKHGEKDAHKPIMNAISIFEWLMEMMIFEMCAKTVLHVIFDVVEFLVIQIVVTHFGV